MRAWALLAVAVLLFAGCASPSDSGDGTTTSKTSKPPASCQTGPGRCTSSTTTGPGTTSPPGTTPTGTGTAGTSGTSTEPPVDENGTSSPPRVWATPQDAAIRPGVQIISSEGQCTSNFIFTSLDNSTVYIGVAAHCMNVSGDVTGTATSGCDPINRPMALGAKAEVQGATNKATLVYSSWATMQATKETDFDTCDNNDFALLQLSPTDAANANPAMLFYGGPTSLAAVSDLQANAKVLTYGNSGLRLGLNPLMQKEGYIVSVTPWWTRIYTVPPGVEGDSGSAVILEDGRAVGDLVTGEFAPVAGASGITNLEPVLAYMEAVAGIKVRLATWDLLTPGVLPPL